MRSVEYIGRAEQIKSREGLARELVERARRKAASQRSHAALLRQELGQKQAELASAFNEAQEDDDSSASGRVSAIQGQIARIQSDLDDCSEKIEEADRESEQAEGKLAEAEAEKQQALFEIQNVARIKAANLAKISGLPGNYASVSAAMSQRFQANLNDLNRAASILGGQIDSFSGGTSGGGSGSHHSGSPAGNGRITSSGGAAAIAGATGIGAVAIPSALHSSQASGRHSTGSPSGGGSRSFGQAASDPVLSSGQRTIRGDRGSISAAALSSGGRQGSGYTTGQASSAAPGMTAFAAASGGVMPGGTVKPARNLTSSQSAHGAGTSVTRGDFNIKNMRSSGLSSGGGTSSGSNGSVGPNPAELPMDALSQYMSANNYGKSDYAVYSRDPEWQRLHRAAYLSLYAGSANAASYQEYSTNPEGYTYKEAPNPRVSLVKATSIQEIRGLDDPGFWSYKERSFHDYVDMARQIPAVLRLTRSGIVTMQELADQGGLIGACAREYFLKGDITAIRVGDSYIMGDSGRHRLAAAIIAGVAVPVMVTGKMEKDPKVEAARASSREEAFRLSQRTQAIPQMISQSSKEELVYMLKDHGMAAQVDFGEMDVRIAREVSQAVFEVKTRYPFLKLGFVGSTQVRNQMAKEAIQGSIAEYLGRFRTANTSESLQQIAERAADFSIERYRPGSSTMAQAAMPAEGRKIPRPEAGTVMDSNMLEAIGDLMEGGRLQGISFNESWTQENGYGTAYEELLEKLKEQEKIGFHPKGSSSVRFLAYHELAHQLDAVLHLSENPEIIAMFQTFQRMSPESQKDHLCEYGNEDIGEFIAEAWAESQCSGSPRSMAMKVDEILQGEAGRLKRQADGSGEERVRERIRER